MIIVFISQLRRKILLALRFLVVLTIIAILIGQLYGLLKLSASYGNWFKKENPGGNHLRVEQFQ